MGINIENGISIGQGINITGGVAPIDLDTIATYLRSYLTVDSDSGGLRNSDFYSYNLDGNEYYIQDGGRDMFDGGNYTAPALISGTTYLTATSIPNPPRLGYDTVTEATTDTDFKYVSLGYGTSPDRRPLTMLGTRNNSGKPIGFQKAGDIGADGLGVISYDEFYTGQTFNGFTTYAFYRQSYGSQGNNATICDLYILLGHSAWSSSFGTVQDSLTVNQNRQGAQYRVYGANTFNVLAITSLLSVDNNLPIGSLVLQEIVQNYTYLIGQALGI